MRRAASLLLTVALLVVSAGCLEEKKANTPPTTQGSKLPATQPAATSSQPVATKNSTSPPAQQTSTPIQPVATDDGDKGEEDKATFLPPSKWDASYFEKQWGVKLKSVKYANDPPRGAIFVSGTVRFILLFEFTRDADNLTAMRQAFGIGPQGQPTAPAFVLCLFDEENVLIRRESRMTASSEITGKKGEAFRASLELFRGDLSQAKKAEFRAVEKPSK